MKFGEYQQSASKTAPKSGDLAYYALKLSAEAGEAVDLVAKHLHQGQNFDRGRIAEELGDVLWSVANLARICGIDLDSVAQENLTKIAGRYPAAFNMLDVIRQG